KGTGKDWGLTLDLWTDKLSLRLDRYEDVVGPDQSTYRAIVRDPVDQIELTIFNLGGNTQTGGYDPNQPQAFYEVVSNHRSTGYELELTANPTKNWRMMLMATKS